ncbi:Subtilisin-like protease SBT5.4 [Striga hermonthica]|uniref:Subtilisin-like protease SBT5.4 n=1 Tax=Striga hermonthica TaxID=68872 RepID=A0A9N7MXN9_STRHE|nr:Subtilisin-like protease SBT5.4 [Striga hermonthica]
MILSKFSSVLALLLILLVAFHEPALALKKPYIVYLGAHNHGPDVTTADYQRVEDSHTELLTSFLGSEQKARDSMFYSYKRHINGFAALLEEEEAAEIAKHPNVVSVLENQERELHTTHSWEFLGLEKDGFVSPSSLWEKARYGEDTIVATLDTGIDNVHGQISKVFVEMKLNDLILRGTNIKVGTENRLIDFRYENIQGFCYYCGKIGHYDRNILKKQDDVHNNMLNIYQFGEWIRVSSFTSTESKGSYSFGSGSQDSEPGGIKPLILAWKESEVGFLGSEGDIPVEENFLADKALDDPQLVEVNILPSSIGVE